MARELVNRGVQTSPTPLGRRPLAPAPAKASRVHNVEALTNGAPARPGALTLRGSDNKVPGPQMLLPESNEDAVKAGSPTQTIKSRSHKPALPLNRPTSSVEGNQDTRSVSLPSAGTLRGQKSSWDMPERRIVSMPDATEFPCVLSAPYPDLLDALAASPNQHEYSGSFASDSLSLLSLDHEHSESRRVRVQLEQSRSSDLPRTPSPPSSPDSVVIIEGTRQLQESFLRKLTNRRKDHGRSVLQHDDDGWITWAKSPPRPIPALHGPLSLPYARCPSGAEGTIIEEPEDPSRAIWGLAADETLWNSHSHASSYAPVQYPNRNPVPSQHIALNSHVPEKGLPPRFRQLSNTEHLFSGPSDQMYTYRSQEHKSQRLTELDESHNRIPVDSLSHRMHEDASLYNERMYRDCHHNQAELSQSHALSNMLTNLRLGKDNQRFEADVYEDFTRGLSLQLPAPHCVSARALPPPLYPPTHPGITRDRSSGYLKPTAPVFVPSHGLMQVAQSHTALHHTAPLVQELKRRTAMQRPTAIDLARRYRRQQDEQTALPTPPNTSSPLWSSHLSPYPDSLLSPNLPNSSHLRTVPSHYFDGQSSESFSEQRRRTTGASTNDLVWDFTTKPLPPATPLSPLDLAALVAALPPNNPILKYLQNIGSSSPLFGSWSIGPPPDTPLPPIPSPYGTSRRESVHKSQAPSHPSLSPESPVEHQSRNLLSQHARSVPLTRLIQRRLASVPEEDFAERFVEDITPPSSRSRTQLNHNGGLGLGLHAPVRLSGLSSTRTPSPFPHVLPNAAQHLRVKLPPTPTVLDREVDMVSAEELEKNNGGHQSSRDAKQSAAKRRRHAGKRKHPFTNATPNNTPQKVG